MRSEPAKLLLVGHGLLARAEVRHDFLDVQAQEAVDIKLRRFADDLIARSQSEGESAADATPVVLQEGDGDE